MEKAHKITNLCYPRGSVVYARFDKRSDYYYLNMRPLIVVSNQLQMFDSLSVIGCGSKDRPGVEISLFNHKYGQWIGDHQYSIAQPYAIFNICTTQIQEFHGVVDVWTMKAIDKAMAFHLGLTDEVPPYMEDIWEELLKPKYRMGTEENTQLKDPHQFGSVAETTRHFEKLPSANTKTTRDIGKCYVKAKEENTDNIVNNIVKFNDTEVSEQKENKLNYENSSRRRGTAVLIIPKSEDPKAKVEESENKEKIIDAGILEIINSMSDDDKVNIIIRRFTAGEYGKIKVKPGQIWKIRVGIENLYNLNSIEFGKKLASRICHQQRNFVFLSKFERCAAILYSNPEDLQIQESIYNIIAKQLIKDYGLKFEDGRSWRGLHNFERLKKLTMK